RRRLAEQLLVEPVPPAADSLREQQPRRDRVHHQPHALPAPPDDPRADEAAERDSAPDAEASLPDGEGPPPMLRHLVPTGDVVVRARADDPERDAPDSDPEDQIPVAAPANPAVTGEGDATRDREQ